MLHHDPRNNLLLVPVRPLDRFLQPVRHNAPPAPRSHRRRDRVLALPRDPDALQDGALRERDKLHGVVGEREVVRAEAREPALVCGRLDDAVDRALVEPAGEHLDRVAHVHDLRVR